MADPESNDLSTTLASRGQTPAIALVLILAATVGAYNLSSRPGGAPSSAGAPKAADASGALSGPPPHADVADENAGGRPTRHDPETALERFGAVDRKDTSFARRARRRAGRLPRHHLDRLAL